MTTRKDIFHHSQKLEPCRRELVHHLELQKDPNRLDHELDQQCDPTKSLDHLLSSPYPDMCPNPSLSLTITLLLVGHCYYLLKKMGRDLSSTFLMAYLKYFLIWRKDFPTSYQSSNMEVHTLSLTFDNMKAVATYLTNGIHITHSRIPSPTQKYTYLHITFYSCHTYLYKNMSHPLQEGSNRSLPRWTLLDVLWQMCHVWITAWNVTGSVLATVRPSYLK